MLSSMRDLALRGMLALVVAAAVALVAAISQARGQAPARGGVLDLGDWDGRGIVSLDGDWQFVPGRLLGPADAWPAGAGLLQVPGTWADIQPAHGMGTYRLQVQCSTREPLMLVLPVQNGAYALSVNGKEVARQGSPGEPQRGHQPGIERQQLLLPAGTCPMEIRVQVSNYEWLRSGLVRSIQVGEPGQVVQRREQSLTRALVAIGATLMVALFSLSFFFSYSMRRGDRTPLYFGLFCASAVLSLGLAAERPFQPYIGWLGFSGQLRLLFANWSMGLAAFPLFLGALYPREAQPWPLRLIAGFSALVIAAALLLPVPLVTMVAPALQVVAAAATAYVGIVLVRALLHGRLAAGVLLLGLMSLVGAIVHDIIYFPHLLASSMLPYGLLGFVVAPAALLALRLSRALAAEELRGLEQRSKADLLLRATKAGVLDWDAVQGVTHYSDRYREMLGLPAGPDAPEPPPFRSLVHPEDAERVHASFVAQLRDRSVQGGIRRGQGADYRMRRADGEVIWVHAEAIALCGTDGRTLRYICTFIDITAIKATEEALATERERLRLLVRSTKAGFGDWDAVRDVVSYTPRFKEMLGYPPDEDTSHWPSIFEMMHPDDQAAAREQFRAMIRRKPGGGEQEPGEPMSYRLRRRDGSYLWIHAEGIAQVDQEGRTERFITSYLDVTHFHEQEEALRAQVELTRTEQRRLDLVVRAARVGIVDWDGRTHETYYSPRFREIRGYAPDADTSGWPDYFKVMIHPEDRARITGRWVTFIRGQGPEGPHGEYYAPEEYRLSREDGSYVWVQVSGIAVRDERGFVLRWIAAIIDITERRAQEQALRASRDQIGAQARLLEEQNEALKESVRLREEVERIGRHDLKTPLNSIVAAPRLLREERKLGPEADELLGIVERAGYRILSMVNLSLDLYKMEQGSYVFRPDAVDLAELVNKVIADLRVHAASKQVQLVLQQAPGAPYAWAEELLCYSLVANLLKNAVEASPEGAAVHIRIGAGGDAGTVLLDIQNQGVVPEALRGSFFQKYATLGKASGTGLGTYSARLMARVQDGDVSMRTSDEEGTTLSVCLRAAPEGKVPATVRHAAERREVDRKLVATLPPMRVLLVDDDEYNLLIVRRLLPSPPFEVDTAINGRVALAAAGRQWPDLVFMDLDMPVMGGLEAVARLREHERASQAKRCTMVALSSHEDEPTQKLALAAGFDRYLVKPVTREAIHATLLELYAPAAGALPAATAAAPVRGAQAQPADVVHVDADIEPVLADFMASRRLLIEALDQAMRQDDRAEVRRIAHQLAGSFALYGFGWASERSRWLEKNFREAAPAEVQALAGALRRHLDTVEIRFTGEAG